METPAWQCHNMMEQQEKQRASEEENVPKSNVLEHAVGDSDGSSVEVAQQEKRLGVSGKYAAGNVVA